MRYRIKGACRESGGDVTVEVDTANEAEALQQANMMNLLVAEIEPLAGDVAREPAQPANSLPAVDADMTRRLNAMRAGSAPDYFALKVVGHAFNVFGCLVILLTLLINLLLLLGVIGGGAQQGNVVGFAAVGGVLAVFNILAGVVVGAFLLAVGQALLAFRDIARNSWKLPQVAELLK